MKNLLFIYFFISPLLLFSQTKFIIEGKTNTAVKGKAVMIMTEPSEFYPFKIDKDTVLIHNHSFVFTGMLKYPEEFRIEIHGEGNHNSLTEPFFISAGYHKITIDKTLPAHDMFEVGYGVNVQNEPVNDEYIKRFLPGYNKVNKRYYDNDNAKSKCNTIGDRKTRQGCFLAVQNDREIVRKSSDNVLLTYAKANPGSPIVPWLLYDGILYRGYSEIYQEVFTQSSKYIPSNINVPLRDLLTRQKIKAPGTLFPLTSFIKSHISKNISQNRYILVDFWFSHCLPCIGQFNELKKTYEMFHKKGFEIIAISVDNKGAISAYEKILEKNKYPWVQILDLDGVRTKKIDVNIYPTSFLLDNNWKIVKTRTNPEVLNSFLEDNLM